MKLADEDQGVTAESPAAIEDVATQQPTQVEQQETQRAESSTANDDGKFTPTDILRDIVAKKGEPENKPAASSAEGEESRQPADAPKPPDNENYTDVPFHKHPRFQQVLRERNTFKGDAERYQNVQSYLDQNSLSPQEAADGLMIMGLAKTNPAECWKLLRPFAEKVIMAAGVVVPPDLQTEVDQGKLSHDAALRIAQERSQRLSLEHRTSFEAQRAQARQEADHSRTLATTADDWATERGRRDPNFDAKLPAIMKEVHWLHRTEGRPVDAAGVKAQLEKAYKAVNSSLPVPERQNGARPVTPIRGGQPSGSTTGAPQSILDIVKAGGKRASA